MIIHYIRGMDTRRITGTISSSVVSSSSSPYLGLLVRLGNGTPDVPETKRLSDLSCPSGATVLGLH
jgi:hypothetical protein